MTDARAELRHDLMGLTFAPATAAILTQVNARAKVLRALPDQVLPPDLRTDRDRLLDVHLADLLIAYRNARTAGTATADTTLVDGLQAVGNEIERLIAAGQAAAGQALEVEGRFLDQRYASDAAELPVDGATRPAAAPQAAETSTTLQHLTPAEMDAILPRSVAAGAVMPATGKGVWPLWLCLLVLVAVAAIFFGVSALYDPNAETAMMRSKIDVVASIDHLHRTRSTREDGGSATTTTFELHGTVRNRADRPLLMLGLDVELLSCPTPTTPAYDCIPIETFSTYAQGVDDLAPGLTAQFRQHVDEPLPDVTGYLRAVLRTGSAPLGLPAEK